MISDQDALRQRQGAGARYDAANAPADHLLLARRSTAFFARKLNELTDRQLDAPPRHEGQETRRQIIARVSYDAREIALVLSGLRTGNWPEDPRLSARGEQVLRGASLPHRALRHLFHHTKVHLNVEWRDLPDAAWDQPMPFGGTARDIPAKRARALWLAAFDLDNGTRLKDLPPDLQNDRIESLNDR